MPSDRNMRSAPGSTCLDSAMTEMRLTKDADSLAGAAGLASCVCGGLRFRQADRPRAVSCHVTASIRRSMSTPRWLRAKPSNGWSKSRTRCPPSYSAPKKTSCVSVRASGRRSSFRRSPAARCTRRAGAAPGGGTLDRLAYWPAKPASRDAAPRFDNAEVAASPVQDVLRKVGRTRDRGRGGESMGAGASWRGGGRARRSACHDDDRGSEPEGRRPARPAAPSTSRTG